VNRLSSPDTYRILMLAGLLLFFIGFVALLATACGRLKRRMEGT